MPQDLVFKADIYQVCRLAAYVVNARSQRGSSVGAEFDRMARESGAINLYYWGDVKVEVMLIQRNNDLWFVPAAEVNTHNWLGFFETLGIRGA